jgi:hypothetical protein
VTASSDGLTVSQNGVYEISFSVDPFPLSGYSLPYGITVLGCAILCDVNLEFFATGGDTSAGPAAAKFLSYMSSGTLVSLYVYLDINQGEPPPLDVTDATLSVTLIDPNGSAPPAFPTAQMQRVKRGQHSPGAAPAPPAIQPRRK